MRNGSRRGPVHARAGRRGRGLRPGAGRRDGHARTSSPAATSPTRRLRRRPPASRATARFGRVELDWSDNGEGDLDGYDVFRATSPAGPFARVNASRLEASAYTDTHASPAAPTYVYVVTASDVANHRSADSAPVTATPPSTTDLLRRYAPELRYETQETYFADSAAEMTDNYVGHRGTNYLVDGSGTRIAAANPANALADLSLGFLGNPVYADGRAATRRRLPRRGQHELPAGRAAAARGRLRRPRSTGGS